MLKSLFGDLTPLRDAVNRANRKDDPTRDLLDAAFVSTTIMEDDDEAAPAPATEPSAATDAHHDELLVKGSPAQAMRAHFAGSRKDTFVRQKLITICDPSHMWAAAVIRALADASGQPIERLHMRDQTSLAPLADIERTTLPRRTDDTLKIYYADIQAEGRDAAEVQIALMERSDLSVVIIGPMAPADIATMLEDIRLATHSLHWQCRNLMFMLPVSSGALMQRIQQLDWPDQVRVEAICESLTSASVVWNRMLAHWQKLRSEQASPSAPVPLQAASAPMPLPDASGLRAPPPPVSSPTTQSTLFVGHAPVATPPTDPGPISQPMLLNTSPGAGPSESRIDVRRASAVLEELTVLDGLIFVALINGMTGAVVTCPAPGPDIDRAALAASEIWKTHRRTLRQLGHARSGDPLEEILVTAGSRYHILRTLRAHPDLFILSVLDKLRSNLAMTRYRIMEAQQVLV
ncbi:MAG: hypothetical protein RLZZ592_802 [Pseudomonadota bacterium]|jgi:hypothetical protein|nr:hypothetical protein [Pseudomonadota bacterium]